MGSLRSLKRNHVEPINMALLFDPEMIQAVQFGTIKDVETLLEQGANPYATDWKLDNALDCALYRDDLRKAELLVSYMTDASQMGFLGRTALHQVASSDSSVALQICLFLLDHGANIDAVDFEGWTPLMHAVYFEHFDIAKLLLERGADAALKNSDGGRALDLLRRGKGYKALKKLLEQAS